MKIVDRKTFLALPENTLFAKYKPCVFEDIGIKLDTVYGVDFTFQDILCIGSTDLIEFCEIGESIPLDLDCAGRDGCFDEDQLFVVFEVNDIKTLIHRLAQCIPDKV